MSSCKKKNYYFGLRAEAVARFYLRCKFYHILASRAGFATGEIDLIATRGRNLIFIEVKARRDTRVTELLSYHQQNRIIKSAKFFLLKTDPKFANYNIRFDLIIIRPWKLPVHIKNAWQE